MFKAELAQNRILASLPQRESSRLLPGSKLLQIRPNDVLFHPGERLRYVYFPSASREAVRKWALKHLLETFFEGSPEKVVEALVREHRDVSDEELERMAQLIDRARREAKRK